MSSDLSETVPLFDHWGRCSAQFRCPTGESKP